MNSSHALLITISIAYSVFPDPACRYCQMTARNSVSAHGVDSLAQSSHVATTSEEALVTSWVSSRTCFASVTCPCGLHSAPPLPSALHSEVLRLYAGDSASRYCGSPHSISKQNRYDAPPQRPRIGCSLPVACVSIRFGEGRAHRVIVAN
ncbi:hypothetical protein B0I35DRAFT_18251 [Stachybotrys elegans]|uniref:Secreted protein n=1 Tax=Stachybotrys elegans TaxID=80388 RepID=A0A8K0WW99_9HYPO|nr:hypothetical protein B0I35DRAFT_18251 [Stachybotrys elegans]